MAAVVARGRAAPAEVVVVVVVVVTTVTTVVVEAEEELEVPVDWVGEEEVLGRYLGRGFGNSYDFGQIE